MESLRHLGLAFRDPFVLSCLFTTLFQAVSDGSHYREETRFHYLRRCEGGGQRAYQYLAERRMDGEEWILFTLTSPFSGYAATY